MIYRMMTTKLKSVKTRKNSSVKPVVKKIKKPLNLTTTKKSKINVVVVDVTQKKHILEKPIEVPRTIDIKPIVDDVTSNSDTDTVHGVRKRRRGRNKKEKIYFSKLTEIAIIEFNRTIDMDIRNEIYETKIKYSFDKLVENIFNTFKFTYFDNSPLEIQRETVTHLVSNIHKFQEGKGKAFSYFSIVAKNYLIFHNNSNYKRFNQHVEISETPSEDAVCLQTEDVHHKNIQIHEFMKLLVNYWEKNVNKIFSKQKDLNIANAIIELFRNCDRLENFNKKTLYLYIREISNCKTQQITKIINKMKNYQSVITKNYTGVGRL